jgi:hypothetical protein
MNLCVHGEYAESIYEHRENTLEESYISCIYGEDAKGILANSPKTPRDIKMGISQLLMEQNEEKNWILNFHPRWL